jgi:hypothetical protein
MMQAMRFAPFVIGLVVLSAGCGGSARWVVRDTGGGLLALDGDHGAARADAERKIAEHCGVRVARVVFEGDVAVRDEETHQRTTEDRIAQTRLAQSGDHTTWVEGQPAYGESGVTLAIDGESSLYDTSHADRHHVYATHTESRVEYECEETEAAEGSEEPASDEDDVGDEGSDEEIATAPAT